jgi:hypothetical protein
MKTYNNNDVLFNVKILNFDNNSEDQCRLINDVHQMKIDGFILKNVFSKEEVKEFLELTNEIETNDFLKTNTGTIIPDPFATISNLEERFQNYKYKKNKFDTFGFEKFFGKLDEIMRFVGAPFEVQVPKLRQDPSNAVPATIRHFYPNMGGLFVHCGYLFQVQSPIYYQAVEPMKKEGQLSFFIVIQQPESGGELTLYDMVWEQVNSKDAPENNDFVLDKNGSKVYLKDVESKKFNPEPGDLLIFYGGKIWHRVEPILGTKPRITLGGFINFSDDEKKCFYWS